MSGCNLLTSNIEFCWDDVTFETFKYMFMDDALITDEWHLLNSTPAGGDRVPYWASMDDVCKEEQPEQGVFVSTYSVADEEVCYSEFENFTPDYSFTDYSGVTAYYGPGNADDITQQEKILFAIAKTGGTLMNCRQAWLAGGMKPLFKSFFVHNAFVKEQEERTEEDEKKSESLQKKITEKREKVEKLTMEAIKEPDKVKREALLAQAKILETEMYELMDKPEMMPVYRNAAYKHAQAIKTFLETDFEETNNRFIGGLKGHKDSGLTMIYALAPVTAGVDDDGDAIPLSTETVEYSMQLYISRSSNRKRAQAFANAVISYRTFNEAMLLIEKNDIDKLFKSLEQFSKELSQLTSLMKENPKIFASMTKKQKKEMQKELEKASKEMEADVKKNEEVLKNIKKLLKDTTFRSSVVDPDMLDERQQALFMEFLPQIKSLSMMVNTLLPDENGDLDPEKAGTDKKAPKSGDSTGKGAAAGKDAKSNGKSSRSSGKTAKDKLCNHSIQEASKWKDVKKKNSYVKNCLNK